MNDDNFFPPRPESKPSIYAYKDTNPQYSGLLKAGCRLFENPHSSVVIYIKDETVTDYQITK